MRIYEHTSDPQALRWAVDIYRWVRSALFDDETNLYFDRISPEGRVERTLWSYNQGTMIGAAVLLHRATKDDKYLVQAIKTADASLGAFDMVELVKQGPAFNAIYLRNLFMLDLLVPQVGHRELATSYGDVMWEQNRNGATGLFRSGESPLNASAPMIEIYSLLAGATPRA